MKSLSTSATIGQFKKKLHYEIIKQFLLSLNTSDRIKYELKIIKK